jgi:hypothetical protein
MKHQRSVSRGLFSIPLCSLRSLWFNVLNEQGVPVAYGLWPVACGL